MQVICGFVFGSACALGILWQLDFKNRSSFWWEGLLSLFKRDSSMHISCLQMLFLGGVCGMITILRCPSWQNSNKNNTFDCLSCKARNGCSGDDGQSVPNLCKMSTPWKWLLAVLIVGQFGGDRGYKPGTSHTLASNESENLLLWVLKASRLLISAACFFKCLYHGRLCCFSELCRLQFTRCSFLIRAVNCLTVYKKP